MDEDMTEIVDPVASDRRRNWGLVLLAGGGMAMTGFAIAVLVILYVSAGPLKYVFYLGLCAMALVGIVLTGFSALLVKRTFRLGRDGVEYSDTVEEQMP
jgi:cation transporter-like permease